MWWGIWRRSAWRPRALCFQIITLAWRFVCTNPGDDEEPPICDPRDGFAVRAILAAAEVPRECRLHQDDGKEMYLLPHRRLELGEVHGRRALLSRAQDLPGVRCERPEFRAAPQPAEGKIGEDIG